MSTGLFPSRQAQGGPRRGYVPKNRRSRLAEFAELLSEGIGPEPAALLLGYTASYGRVLLGKIRKDINDRQRAARFGDWA